MTEIHKRKIGETNSGIMKLLWQNPEYRKRQSETHKGHKGYWTGKHRSEETKQKMSERMKGRHLSPKTEFKKEHIPKHIGQHNLKISGSKHWNWQGGITPVIRAVRELLEYKEWRRDIFERDNYTCQKYGVRGGSLVAHHIFNFAKYPELRFAIDNGITLSNKAHQEFHKKYGVKNNTREQLEEFLRQ